MKAHGFSDVTTASVRKTFTCPRCGFVFSLVYARSFACQGCSEAVRGCPKVRCNKCDSEFFIDQSTEIHGKGAQRRVADHMGGIMVKRQNEFGTTPNRRSTIPKPF